MINRAQIIANRRSEAEKLLREGKNKYGTGYLREALEIFESTLSIYQKVDDRAGITIILNYIGVIYDDLGEKEKALEYYNQSLILLKAAEDSAGQAVILNNIGKVYDDLGERGKALEYYDQSLSLRKATGDRAGEAATLNNIGRVFDNLGEKRKALEYYNQSLPLFKETENLAGQAVSLTNIGKVHSDLGQKEKALEYYKQSLRLFKVTENFSGQATTINNIGKIYDSLGQKKKALDYYNESLAVFRLTGNRVEIAVSLTNIGGAYSALGEKQKALEYYNQSLQLRKATGDRAGEAITINNIGRIYDDLGEKQKALEYYNQSLPLFKVTGDRAGEATTLNNIGKVYDDLGEKQKALEYYNQTLPLKKAVSDRAGEAITLNNIGGIFQDLGDKGKALEYYNNSLILHQETGDRAGEAITLNNIGSVYDDLGNKEKALEYYNQSLPLIAAAGNRAAEAITLWNIAFLLSELQQSVLAIIFYKQSVNITESLRKDIQDLSAEIQQTFTQSVADRYRQLADLLLQQGRIVEALQVLDLLKVQELQDFLKDIKGSQRTAQGLDLFSEEEQILTQLGTSATSDLNAYLNSAKVRSLAAQLQKSAASRNLKLSAYTDLNTRLQTLSDNSALLYPLLLNNRLELVFFTPNTKPIRRSVQVSEKEIRQAISDFRESLQDSSDPHILSRSQQLYEWLLKPLETDLKQAGVDTIIYAPDGPLRYVPLAALYDSQQWAIEKYQINYVTAFGLTDITPQSTQSPQIMAGAYTDKGITTVEVNQKKFRFGAIPAALPEVNSLAQRFPDTKVLLAGNFNRQAMTSDQINRYGIVHLATHGKLVNGAPEDSFILLNNGEYITLREIKNWQLPNVDLVVLSACQTALGEKLGSGIEIIGFGYQLQVAQAREAIASLWEVSDDGTNSLMNLFYEQLQKGQRSPTEALGAAQRGMINNVKQGSTAHGRATIKVGKDSAQTSVSFSHPYYWAPFILIGNGM